MDQMRRLGIRISLWQTPNVAKKTDLYAEACEKGYLPRKRAASGDASSFGDVEYGGRIDYTNPEAVRWYQGLLKRLFDLGAEVIKTDFGEKIDDNAVFYNNMSYGQLHNLYALLYQKAAFEITEQVKGKGRAVIARRMDWVPAVPGALERRPRRHLGWIGRDRGRPACRLSGLLSGAMMWVVFTGFRLCEQLARRMSFMCAGRRWARFLPICATTALHPGNRTSIPWWRALSEWLKLRYALIPYLYEQVVKRWKAVIPFSGR